MQLKSEVPLEHLAARYSDDDEEQQPAAGEQPGSAAARPQGAATPPPPAPATRVAEQLSGDGSEDEDSWEDDDWDSESEELASALEWADLREGATTAPRLVVF